jgi:hypothetical protein
MVGADMKTMPRMRWSVVLSAAVLGAVLGCGGDDRNGDGGPDGASSLDGEAMCHAPAHLVYSCQPGPASAEGCHGGPPWDGPAPDQDKTFPTGCHATLPFCAAFYPNFAQTCDCMSLAPGEPVRWVCPV